MKSSNYYDITSIVQIIGNIYNNPDLLDATDKYFFLEEDFANDFQKTIFGAIYNLHQLGAKNITIASIEDYLQQRPKKLALYKANDGAKYILTCSEKADISTFDYYYNRMKKMTLLKQLNLITGMDLTSFYDPDNILDAKKKQKQEDWLDNTSLEQIANLIDDWITQIRLKYVDDADGGGVQAGEGVDELLESLKAHPEIGYPLFGHFINTVVRGARLRKFYLRSAATGVGKTRSMIADACYIGCSQMFDTKTGKWINTGKSEPVIYIATEQPLDEIQTMMIAFLSGVNEENIINGKYLPGEWERVVKAAQLLKQGKVFFEYLPDFSLQDIENTIKRNIRERDAKYVFLDYLHTSMKILAEITKSSGGVKLREDNILFMISIRLKDLCNQYDVFIMSATQLNGDYVEAKEYDQNLLRGAKSIADKIDVGMIMLQASKEDIESLQTIIQKGGFEIPDTKISVYKNRRGRWKNILLWAKSDKGTCRIDPLFVTSYNYELQEIEDLKIKVEDESPF